MAFFNQQKNFQLFEELADAASGWDVDFIQLSASKGDYFLHQLATPDLLFSRVLLGASFEQRGGPTQGYRTFALMAPGCCELIWCQQPITHHSLMVFPRHGDFNSVSHAGFHMYLASLSQQLLEQVAHACFQRDINELLPAERDVLHCHPGEITRLHNLFLQLGSLAHRQLTPAVIAELLQLQFDICLQILNSTNRSPSQKRYIKKTKRQRALRQSLELIASKNGVLRVSDLLDGSGVSLRTLEYAFLDYFSVTPKQYLKSLRFHCLHKQLLQAEPGRNASVTSISEANGFRPSGQLSKEYYDHFGEQPSQTLRRRL